MRTCYRVKKGCPMLITTVSLAGVPGIVDMWVNPFGAGANVLEIEHDRDPDQLPAVIKDATIGEVILERL